MKGFGEDYLYFVYNGDYYIPKDKIERFKFLSNKIKRVSDNRDYSELYIGLGIQFRAEFDRYQIKFKRGQIWIKETESWMGNDLPGTRVKIVKIEGNMIIYRKCSEWFGEKYCLNKFSFIRIFERCI